VPKQVRRGKRFALKRCQPSKRLVKLGTGDERLDDVPDLVVRSVQIAAGGTQVAIAGSLRGTHSIDRATVRDGHNPTLGGAAVRLELIGLLPDFEKDLLRNFLGLPRIPQHTLNHGHHNRAAGGMQPLKSAGVARSYGDDEIGP
jgi:hypothetical protein